MVKQIVDSQFYISKAELQAMFADEVLVRMQEVLDKEFLNLMIPERIDLVKMCLQYRFKTIKQILQWVWLKI